MNNKDSLFLWKEKISFSKALPMSLQHLLAMIVGNITPALIIAAAAKLSQNDKIILVQASLLIAAITTFIMVLTIKGAIGSGLPVVMGVSFSYIPAMVGIVTSFDIATVFGAQLIGAIFALFLGFLIKYILKLFPPVVTGTVVLSIGLSLYPVAINYMAGGLGSKTYGSYQNWTVAVITLIIAFFISNYTKGLFRLSSILIAMLVGYLFSFAFGMIDFSGVKSAGLVEIPKFMHFGLKFELSTILSMIIMFSVNTVQAVGDFSATTVGAYDRLPEKKELEAGIKGYGISNMLGAFFGGLPTATYSQNVGIVSSTKVVNRNIFVILSFILTISAIFPKISAVLTTIPAAVLGGATISVFAIISMNGIKLIIGDGFSSRNATIVGLSIAIGMGITQTPAAFSEFPNWFHIIFGRSTVVISTLIAVLLNTILPKE